MKKNNINIEKELYRLWIEYLKQSEDYKIFCQWAVEKRKKPNLPAVPKKFQKDKNGSAPKELLNYYTFGNIHDSSFSFDDWWKHHKEKLSYAKGHKSPKTIEDFTEHIGKYIDITAESFKRHHMRDPSLQELKTWLTSHIMGNVFSNSLYLMVDITDDTVIEQFKKHVREKRKKPNIMAFSLTCKRSRMPILKYETVEELQTYLDVYNLRKQGLTPRDVIKKHNPKHKETEKGYCSIERLYRIYNQKAKEILNNVEHGFFPVYGKKRKTNLS